MRQDGSLRRCPGKRGAPSSRQTRELSCWKYRPRFSTDMRPKMASFFPQGAGTGRDPVKRQDVAPTKALGFSHDPSLPCAHLPDLVCRGGRGPIQRQPRAQGCGNPSTHTFGFPPSVPPVLCLLFLPPPVAWSRDGPSHHPRQTGRPRAVRPAPPHPLPVQPLSEPTLC